MAKARPISEYHEDMGPVLWWKFPIDESPYVGGPNDLGREVAIQTCAYTAITGANEEIQPYRGGSVQRINVGGWPGYHTHFTMIEMPDDFLSPHEKETP